MVVQNSNESAEDSGPRSVTSVASVGSVDEAPATITADILASSNENGSTENIEKIMAAAEIDANDSAIMIAEESPEVRRATDQIISNSVSIDVIVSPKNGDDNLEKVNSLDKDKNLNGKRASVKFNPEIDDIKEEKRSKKDGNNKMFGTIGNYFRTKTKGMTSTQIAILCIFPFVEFFAATVISIQGPFYPKVAREKGATPSEYGLVFGSFEIIVFIMAPIYGAKMGTLNPHRLFNYGIFTTSITCILFGFVHYIDDRTGFIFVSLIIRIIEAIGDAAFVTASFSIIAIEFPESVATTFAMMETFYGFGMIAGPTVGGALFGAGGFTLPFAVMGGLLFISALATYHFITRVSTINPDKIVSSSSFGMFKMLKIPAIALTAFGAFAAATGIGFLSNNLEHHLAQFQLENGLTLSEFQIGSIFMLNGGVYALSAPLWGRLCDRTKELKVFSMIGAVLTIFGFSLVGPLPFFPGWNPSILVICIGLVIFGLGLGSTLVSAFVQFLHDALANGHPENVSTHGLVSGLWTSMVALGFFVGPTCGGFLDDAVGFRWGTLFIILEQLILVGLLIYFFLYLRKKSPSFNEEDQVDSSQFKEKDNLDDIVITYELKMNTPKPKPRTKSPSQKKLLQEQQSIDNEIPVKIKTENIISDVAVIAINEGASTETIGANNEVVPPKCSEDKQDDNPKSEVEAHLEDENAIIQVVPTFEKEDESKEILSSKEEIPTSSTTGGLENPNFVHDS